MFTIFQRGQPLAGFFFCMAIPTASSQFFEIVQRENSHLFF